LKEQYYLNLLLILPVLRKLAKNGLRTLKYKVLGCGFGAKQTDLLEKLTVLEQAISLENHIDEHLM